MAEAILMAVISIDLKKSPEAPKTPRLLHTQILSYTVGKVLLLRFRIN